MNKKVCKVRQDKPQGSLISTQHRYCVCEEGMLLTVGVLHKDIRNVNNGQNKRTNIML